jgi:hypothetical protein
MSDLILSRDGSLNGKRRGLSDPQQVRLYLTNPDLIYADKFNLPRHG